MDESSRETITWILGTTIAVFFLIGLAVKWMLMPYLREHLVAPMKKVEKQVTENHHSNVEPTLLDRLDDVQQDVKRLSEAIHVIATMYEGHTEWSARWTALIEREIDDLRNHKDKQSPGNPLTK